MAEHMQEHTPGPWEFRAEDWMIVGPNHEAPINKWQIAAVRPQGRETAANARLIAAAPEMLSELRQTAVELTEAASMMRRELPSVATLYDKAAARVRFTIAKATGTTAQGSD